MAVAPALADSVQFHAAFQVGQRFSTLLRRSGFSKIYICPKTEQGVYDDHWKVIWLPANTNILELESQANSIAGAAGLVRARKGIGLRVETNNFSKAWSTLKPDMEVPETSPLKWKLKIHPLPLGTTPEVLRQWALKNFDWRIRPLKAIGAKVWLVATDRIPDAILTFNSQPLLLQHVQDKGLKVSSAISAGPRYFPKTIAADKTDIFKTGDPYLDPWRKHAAAATPTSPDGAKSTSSSQEQRPVAGPIATRLEQQDARLHAMEAMVTQTKEGTDTKIGALELQQNQLHQTVTNHMQQTQQGFEVLHKDQASLHATLTEAITKQEQRMTSSFEELKELFKATRGVKRTAKKDHGGDSEESDMIP